MGAPAGALNCAKGREGSAHAWYLAANHMQPAPEAGWDRIETLRRDAEFVLSRGIATQGSGRVLMLAAASEQPAPRTIERLKHEYALRHQLDPAWAAKPRALAGEQGRTVLVLDDPG